MLFTGFINHSAVSILATTTLFYVFHLFLGVAFPFRTKFLYEKRWKLRLHITEGIGIVLLSTLAPVVYVSTSDYQTASLPPSAGQPNIIVAFYTLVLPQCIGLAAIVNMNIYSLYRIHKVRMLIV